MEQVGEIVFESSMGNIRNQFIKTETGYLRQQIFPSGVIYEGDYTQEEYDKLREEMRVWDALKAAQPKKIPKTKVKFSGIVVDG